MGHARCVSIIIATFTNCMFLCSVANHVGNQNNGDWSNFAKFVPFNDQSHYHSYCLITDFNDQNQVSRTILSVLIW